MKRILGLFIAMAVTAGAFAQDSTAVKRDHHHHRKADLNLSEQQTTDLKAINSSFMNSAKALRNDPALSKEDKKNRMTALEKERQEKIKGVLTAEQYSKWQQHRAAMHERMASRKTGKRGGDRFGQKIKEELNLTDAQQQQFKSLSSNFRSQAKSLRADTTLSAEQKKQEFSKLLAAHNDKVRQLLNAEQYEKYQQWMSKRQQRMQHMRKAEDRDLPGKS